MCDIFEKGSNTGVGEASELLSPLWPRFGAPSEGGAFGMCCAEWC
jgi:hypothetical protein